MEVLPSFSIHHPSGEMESSPPVSIMEQLLDELAAVPNGEHSDVGIVHQSGWGLSIGLSLDLTWEDVEGDGGIFHLRGVQRGLALDLMRAVATGDFEFVRSQRWQPGYPR